MAYSMLGARGVMMLVLGCVGCDAAASEEPADPTQQGLGNQSGEDSGIGYLVPTPIVADAGTGGLTVKPAPKLQGDAGQPVVQGDAGQPVETDAGVTEPVTHQVQILDTTNGLPDCAAVYFRDLDGDGFGDAKAKVTSCTKPAGYVENSDDCYDDNERAHPNATGQFLQHRGDGSFDFDCDGVETQVHTQIAACPDLLGCTGLGCDLSALEAAADKAENAGWSAQVPACGQEGSWGLSVSWYPGVVKASCSATTGATLTQTCR